MTTFRFGTIVTALAAVTLAIGSGCGDSTAGSGGGTNGSGGSGGSPSTSAVNGCDVAKAKDLTASSVVSVSFPVSGTDFAYDPACIKVKAGTKVIFSGPFAAHPLTGGTVADDGTLTPDDKSPIKETKTGDKATFSLKDKGSFGYFCEFHAASGMKGAVFVE